MTDKPLRAKPEDRAPPSGGAAAAGAATATDSPPAAKAAAAPPISDQVQASAVEAASNTLSTAHTRPIGRGTGSRSARGRGAPDGRPAWSGFLLGVLALVFAVGMAGLLWHFAGGERTAAVATSPAPLAPSDALMEIETLLDQLGFPPGPLDGVIDADSVGAIRDFQVTAGLPADGAANAALLEELRAAQAELSSE